MMGLLNPFLHASTIELSLREALEMAPKANFQVLLAGEAVTSQSESVRAARSALMPQMQLEVSQSRAMAPNTDPLAELFNIPTRFYVDRFDTVLRARMSLLSTRSIDDWKLSKLNLEATRFHLDNTVQDILQMIANAYFFHLRNQRRLEVIDATLKRDLVLLQIATDQKEAGVATALDVTRAEVGLARNELARLQQETLVMESAMNLKRILNLPLGDHLKLSDDEISNPSTPAGTMNGRLDAVLSQRADYQQLLSEFNREKLAYSAAKRERLPSLTLGGQWGYASQTWSDNLHEQWAIQLGVSMPVFEGFRIDSNKQLAASAIRQKEIQLADLKTQIEMDYRLVIQQLESSRQQVEVGERARELNVREFELEKIRFQQGVADNSDVVNAQAKLADAEDALVDAKYQFLIANIELARIEGDVQSLIK